MCHGLKNLECATLVRLSGVVRLSVTLVPRVRGLGASVAAVIGFINSQHLGYFQQRASRGSRRQARVAGARSGHLANYCLLLRGVPRVIIGSTYVQPAPPLGPRQRQFFLIGVLISGIIPRILQAAPASSSAQGTCALRVSLRFKRSVIRWLYHKPPIQPPPFQTTLAASTLHLSAPPTLPLHSPHFCPHHPV